ncbi:hypothetical protein J6590_007974 [Homalodisca vitripennis]|nr:hypothetical protein J6590_007974 [Homalodisca vitripennis]
MTEANQNAPLWRSFITDGAGEGNNIVFAVCLNCGHSAMTVLTQDHISPHSRQVSRFAVLTLVDRGRQLLYRVIDSTLTSTGEFHWRLILPLHWSNRWASEHLSHIVNRGEHLIQLFHLAVTRAINIRVASPYTATVPPLAFPPHFRRVEPPSWQVLRCETSARYKKLCGPYNTSAACTLPPWGPISIPEMIHGIKLAQLLDSANVLSRNAVPISRLWALTGLTSAEAAVSHLRWKYSESAQTLQSANRTESHGPTRRQSLNSIEPGQALTVEHHRHSTLTKVLSQNCGAICRTVQLLILSLRPLWIDHDDAWYSKIQLTVICIQMDGTTLYTQREV